MTSGSDFAKRPAIMAVDLGTTSAKAVAVSVRSLTEGGDGGFVLAKAERDYPLLVPSPGYAEQEPERIRSAAEGAVREALALAGLTAGDIAAVAFSSAMHALIAVDAAGDPLTPCITWADQRAAAMARRLRETGHASRLAQRTGVPVHAMTPLCKLMWLREREPELFAAAAAFVGIREYVFARWCGGPYLSDESVAGGTGLYNVHTGAWDPEALALAGIGEERLPALVPSSFAAPGGLLPGPAAAMGLAAGTPVVIGGADGVLANLGAGAVEPGVAAVTVGTSGAVRVALPRPAADAAGRLFCYPAGGDLWIAGGPVNSGGVVLRWLRDKLVPADAQVAVAAGEDPYERLVSLALEVPPGADGLLCLPHLAGERAPHWDEDARGVFVGLSLGHDRRHMIRAALEGIVFGLRAVAEAVAELGGPIREIRVSGGFFRSAPLRQLTADMIGCPVAMADTSDASALGAARFALEALGLQAGPAPGIAELRHPDAGASAVYNRLYPVYRSLYGSLAAAFADIASFQRDWQMRDVSTK
ncbi:gluconate kinase [Paenibacillus cisolokensis]|uniref:Gluconate kinase n=1 Tax=Paenibacillus cisolokensis TaxID=1658519 RepID=A0ABQ4MZW9_9BACL|nr:gluconokinase [Paenibacillus cisolokensis]GIQ61453.1 gluconate kinase [Paenibacillus cisolokensis]